MCMTHPGHLPPLLLKNHLCFSLSDTALPHVAQGDLQFSVPVTPSQALELTGVDPHIQSVPVLRVQLRWQIFRACPVSEVGVRLHNQLGAPTPPSRPLSSTCKDRADLMGNKSRLPIP